MVRGSPPPQLPAIHLEGSSQHSPTVAWKVGSSTT